MVKKNVKMNVLLKDMVWGLCYNVNRVDKLKISSKGVNLDVNYVRTKNLKPTHKGSWGLCNVEAPFKHFLFSFSLEHTKCFSSFSNGLFPP
jgi:hypothetical protein